MGRNLEQIVQDEDPQVVRAAKDSTSQMLVNIHLAELRERMKLTQTDIAKILGVGCKATNDIRYGATRP